MCEYFCIRIIDFMLSKKGLADFDNLFSSNSLKKNNKIILEYFQ